MLTYGAEVIKRSSAPSVLLGRASSIRYHLSVAYVTPSSSSSSKSRKCTGVVARGRPQKAQFFLNFNLSKNVLSPIFFFQKLLNFAFKIHYFEGICGQIKISSTLAAAAATAVSVAANAVALR